MHARGTGHKGRVGTIEKGLVAERLGNKPTTNYYSRIHNPMNCRTDDELVQSAIIVYAEA